MGDPIWPELWPFLCFCVTRQLPILKNFNYMRSINPGRYLIFCLIKFPFECHRNHVWKPISGILYSFSPCSCFDPLFLSALFVCFFLVSIFGSFWCILGSSGSRICVAAFVLHPCPIKGSSTVPPFCSTWTQWIWGEVWGIIVNNFAHQRSFGNQDSSQRKLCLVIVSVHTTKKTTKSCTCSLL